MPIGTIMAVVAVFEIHIERNIVGSMKPSISSRGLVPLKQIYPTHRLHRLKGRSNYLPVLRRQSEEERKIYPFSTRARPHKNARILESKIQKRHWEYWKY
jgi:hypothetical protein